MKKRSVTFLYRAPQPVSGWGCRFDSLTELKFAVSILGEYAFMRSPVSMYFHPTSGELSHFPKRSYRRYTPDFLIRHKETARASLIEIKPRAYEGQPQLDIHELVATTYIRSMKFDWTYKVVYDDQVILSDEQLLAFRDCLRLGDQSSRFQWYEDYHYRVTGLPPRPPSNRELDFLMRGWPVAAQRSFF